jgi:hypothetical protein
MDGQMMSVYYSALAADRPQLIPIRQLSTGGKRFVEPVAF